MEGTGRVRASACRTLQWRHVRRRGREGPSRAWQQGAWEVSARAPACLPLESRAGRGRVSGVGGAGAQAQADWRRGGSWRWLTESPGRTGRDCGADTGPAGRSGDRGLRRPFQRVLSRRGAAGVVPAPAGRSLCDRAGDARTPLARTLGRLGPPSRNRPTPGGLGLCCFCPA